MWYVADMFNIPHGIYSNQTFIQYKKEAGYTPTSEYLY